MTAQIRKVKLFKQQRIDSIWDEEQEKWFFLVKDVIYALTDSNDINSYIKKMRQRDPLLSENWQQIITPILVSTRGGMQRKNYADTQGILRLIQSIPSKKAEPFKHWLAQVGAERLDQIADPERSIHQALQDYKNLGRSDNWINQRLKSIEIRKDLTNEWQAHGIKSGIEFASLTDIISKTWSGKTTKEYKRYKNLQKENLRDNMTNEELVLTMLAELSTKNITVARDPHNFQENAQCAKDGGGVAKVARDKLEQETGHSLVSPENYQEITQQTATKERIESHSKDSDYAIILAHIDQFGSITISEAERATFGLSRRTLQRRLKELISKDMIVAQGATNRLRYVFSPRWKKLQKSANIGDSAFDKADDIKNNL